ncbi:MAG: (d)CMP kinase [Planctomycetes bacterium]|nr:(d)CMP kinase [Planctomycetota bacterium]
MIVTIDGPAGAGKSTVALGLAERLGFRFLDTGAMYRAVARTALARRWPMEDAAELARRSAALDIQVADDRVLVDGEDVTDGLREPLVASNIHFVADNPAIREQLVRLQRARSELGDLVTEGRDQGTVAFPDAECKIFLTASAEERAKRRHDELRLRDVDIDYETVLEDQRERDRRDAERPVGPLVQAEDAIVVVTDGLTRDEVIEHLERLVRNAAERIRRGPAQPSASGGERRGPLRGPGGESIGGGLEDEIP